MRRQDLPRKNNRASTSTSSHTANEKSSSLISYDEESDLDDTFKQLDTLLADLPDTSPPATRTLSDEANRYFDEIIEMLMQSDRQSNHEQIIMERASTPEEPYDLFDEILNDIPEEQMPIFRRNVYNTSGEVRVAIDEMEHDLEKISKKNTLTPTQMQHEKKYELEIVEPAYRDQCMKQRKGMSLQSQLDDERNLKNLQAIVQLVKGLNRWSPAKNAYLKIIRDNKLSAYDKVQQLIVSAHSYVEKNARNRKGFFLKVLNRKSNTVHERIAGFDINNHQEPEASPGAALR